MKKTILLLLFATTTILSIACSPVKASNKVAADVNHASSTLQLIESWPVGTTLDNKNIEDAGDAWLRLVEGAKKSIDFGQFYANSQEGSKLSTIISAIERASERGVKIRFIFDKKLMAKQRDNIAFVRLSEMKNVEIRMLPTSDIMGGVQHAKYFVVDHKIAYFGSQNFDWRSIEHIVELGVESNDPVIVKALSMIFNMDWALAAGEKVEKAHCQPRELAIHYGDQNAYVSLAMSPKGFLPHEKLWDLPQIIEAIEDAKSTINIQLLNYSTTNYDKTRFFEIDEALIAAAKRGVKIQLLVSDWSKTKKYLADLKRLQAIDNITTKMVTIPDLETYIPFARVIHAKYMTVDDSVSWIGTSNWSGDYFYQSRNVGLVVRSKKFNEDLQSYFQRIWSSEYARETDVNATYEPRKHY